MATAAVMPQNPNQAAGASMLPMSYAAPATALGATSPVASTGLPTGTTGPGASTAGQPFGAPVSGLNFASNPINISSGISTADGSNTVVGDFSDTYGKGTGTALVNQLAGLGTATNTAVQATNAQMMQQAQIQEANMKAQQAAAGISPDSSSSALMEGDFESQVNTNMAAVDANMELQGQQTLISTLANEGQQHGPDTSAWDTFGDVMGMVGQAAGAVITGGATLALPGGGLYGPNSLGSEIGAAAGGKSVSGGGATVPSSGYNPSIYQGAMNNARDFFNPTPNFNSGDPMFDMSGLID